METGLITREKAEIRRGEGEWESSMHGSGNSLKAINAKVIFRGAQYTIQQRKVVCGPETKY